MKIGRFSVGGGDPRYGVLDGDDWVVFAGDPMFQGMETTGERVAVADAKLLAPVIPRSKVVGIARNYGGERGDAPLVFLKPNTTVVGPGDAIQLPPVGTIDHEGELVIVIGRIAKRVKAENYADVVFGYTVGNDVGATDVIMADRELARGKGYDTFAPIGPVIETEFDWAAADIQTSVDGATRISGNTRDMLHSVPEIIEFVSDIWTLLPGDVIMTGSPVGSGVIVAGQTVDVTIDGIGTLSNPVRDRA